MKLKYFLYLLSIIIGVATVIFFLKKVNMSKELSFTIVPATIQEADFIDNQLAEYMNVQVPFTQKENLILKNYVIKDRGKIVAGIKADIYYWKILYIEVLYLEPNYRGKGLGSALLEKVEQEARSIGVTLVHLNTFDFQAKDFYLKHGYEIFGTLDDCPPGHKRYYMKKKL